MENQKPILKKNISVEGFVCLGVLIVFFAGLSHIMGGMNMMNTLLNTAYDLLMTVVFRIMAIAVVAGAIAYVLTEFGVIAIANSLLAPLMKPIYGLPGASVIAVFTTYLSDNPAVLALADDHRFRKYFKKYQLPALTNLGTAFGMGLIVSVFMMKIEAPGTENVGLAVLIGNLGAVVGSIVSVRIMLQFMKKKYGIVADAVPSDDKTVDSYDILKFREVREGSTGSRIMTSLLEGGKTGVDVGFSIIPGVLIICSIVMILTFPMPEGGYTGAAYEGVGFLTWIGTKLQFILKPLFGFQSPECVSIPITALGAAGAAIGSVPAMVSSGVASVHDIAVFTAMCMCWSGYLSTHIAMMDSLKFREATGNAIFAHAIGGLCAGVAANFMYKLAVMFL